MLAEGLRKKYAPRSLYKSTTENMTYFKKSKTFIIGKSVPLDEDTYYYWLSQENDNKINSKGFISQESLLLQNDSI